MQIALQQDVTPDRLRRVTAALQHIDWQFLKTYGRLTLPSVQRTKGSNSRDSSKIKSFRLTINTKSSFHIVVDDR